MISNVGRKKRSGIGYLNAVYAMYKNLFNSKKIQNIEEMRAWL